MSEDERERSLKEYQETVVARARAFEAKLKEHGFVRKVPRVEWRNGNQSVYFYGEDGSCKLLCPESGLIRFLNGEDRFSPVEEEALREWYEISFYRLGHESHLVEEKLKDPDLGREEWIKLQKELATFKEEFTDEALDARRKRVRAYEYGETDPKRVELLDKMITDWISSSCDV